MDDGYVQMSTENFLSDEPIVLAIIYSPLYKLYTESQTQQQNQARMWIVIKYPNNWAIQAGKFWEASWHRRDIWLTTTERNHVKTRNAWSCI